MGEIEYKVLETKLDVLIGDFQRFREVQEKVNKEVVLHSASEDAVQAKILTTLRWHSVIGGGVIVSMGALWAKVMGL